MLNIVARNNFVFVLVAMSCSILFLGCPPSVKVPDIVGMTESEAVLAIEAAGLEVGFAIDTPSVIMDIGSVSGCAPGVGRSVSQGSSVDIYVSSGIEMIAISAGMFYMGDPWSEGDSNQRPVHEVTLSGYNIGKYEVTNQEYVEILNWANDEGYLTTASASSVEAYGQELLDIDHNNSQISWNGSQFVVDRREGYFMANHPVVLVSWYGAVIYCNWLSINQGFEQCYNMTNWTCDFSKNGYHLPTEAQWERAAAWDAGSSYHYRYANSSDNISYDTVNYHIPGSYANPLGLSSYPYTSPVGYFTGITSPSGCYDMNGNVSEWCDDWMSRVYTSSPVTNPEGPATGTYRMARGSSWDSYVLNCVTAMRSFGGYPDFANSGLGFRVVRTP